MLCSNYTWILCKRFHEEGGTVGSVADSKGARLDEVSDYPAFSGHTEELRNAIWVSALYGSTFMKYIAPTISCLCRSLPPFQIL